MHGLYLCSLLLVVYGVSIFVEADFQSSYHLRDPLANEDEISRKKRSDLFMNTLLTVLDPDGNTSLTADICADPVDSGLNVSISISNIAYINDAEKDSLWFYFNNNLFGNLITRNENYNITDSGPVGQPISINNGTFENALKIVVKTNDAYNITAFGLSIVEIEVTALNQNPTTDILCSGNFTLCQGSTQNDEMCMHVTYSRG